MPMVCLPLDMATDADYELAIFNASDFTNYNENEQNWVKLAALRYAMALHPRSEWFWYLDQVLPVPRNLTSVRNNNEPSDTDPHTLPLARLPPRAPPPRNPRLPTRNNNPHALPPRPTALPNKSDPNTRQRHPAYRLHHRPTG